MNVVIWIGLSLILHGLVYLYLRFKEPELIKDNGIKIILVILCVVLVVLQWRMFAGVKSLIDIAKILILYITVIVAGIVDLKKKIIPNNLILFGLGCRVLIYICEAICGKTDIINVLLNSAYGLIIAAVLLVISALSHQALGMGDVKLFAVIGVYLGLLGTYGVLFVSAIVSAVVALILLLMKKKDRKDVISFGPFIAIGYMFVIFFGYY